MNTLNPNATAQQSFSRKRTLALTLLAAFLGWLLDGVELGLFPVLARPALQGLLPGASEGEIGSKMGQITAAFLVGAALGGVMFGWLGDRIGRVKAMSWSVLCYSLFSAAGYFAQAPWHLAVVRFLAALGMGGEWALGVALVMESWPDHLRPWLAAAIGAASNLGMLLIGWIALLFPVTATSWRWMFLVGASPAVLTLFIRFFVPESDKWTAASATTNARSAQSGLSELRTILTLPLLHHTLLGILLSSVALIGSWGSVSWIPAWADQLTHGSLPQAKATAHMTSCLGATIGSFLGPLLLAKLPRRWGYALLCLASFACSCWLFRLPAHWDSLFLLKVGCIALTTASFYGFFPLYLPELFPTRVRATGQGLAFNAGRIIAAFGALLSGELVRQLGGYAAMGAVITLIYIPGLLLSFCSPETQGKPLPD